MKKALITGANKGIGFEIARALLKLKDPSWHVFVGSRNAARGQSAVKTLETEAPGRVEMIEIDIDDEKSCNQAKAQLEEKKGTLDALILNAGIATKGDAFDEQVASSTIGTNYFGTQRSFHLLKPLLAKHARVVVVSSRSGTRALDGMSDVLRAKFLAPDLTEAQLDSLMRQFIQDVKDNSWEAKGWPKTTYGVSKAGLTMWTRLIARDFHDKTILINSMCPGWCRTDMAGPKAPKSAADGAVTALHLAQLGNGNVTGRFWSDCKPMPYCKDT